MWDRAYLTGGRWGSRLAVHSQPAGASTTHMPWCCGALLGIKPETVEAALSLTCPSEGGTSHQEGLWGLSIGFLLAKLGVDFKGGGHTRSALPHDLLTSLAPEY